MIGFGKRLRELRLENRLTMENAAKIVGIAKSTYAGYESEFRQPSLDKLSLFADHYRVSVDYLLCLTETKRTGDLDSLDAKELFSKKHLHWEGVPLEEDELSQIKDLLEAITAKKSNKKLDKDMG
jgi:transcriptional regulator with XRE-family HTH domain